MIQRIQTVYLLLVIVAIVAFIFVPFGGIEIEGTKGILIIKEIVVFLVLSLIVGTIALIAIFLFHNRKLQMRIVLINIIVTITLIGMFIYGLIAHVGLSKYTFGAGAVFPLFVLFFNLLAYNGIKSDDKLVKSMDRLR